MVCFVLNIIISIILVVLSFAIDSRAGKDNVFYDFIVRRLLSLSSLFALMAITLALCFWAPRQLALFTGRLVFTFTGWTSVSCCAYMLCFKGKKQPAVIQVIKWMLNAGAFYMMFMWPGAFNSIDVDYFNVFSISSGKLFSGQLGRMVPVTKFPVYCMLYMVLIPMFTTLMVLVRSEHSESVVDRQKYVLLCLGILSSWILFIYFYVAQIFNPMIFSLVLLSFLPEILFFLRAEKCTEVWNRTSVVRSVLRFLSIFLFPAVMEGTLYSVFRVLFAGIPAAVYMSFTLSLIVLVIIWNISVVRLEKLDFMRDSRYADDFESEIASLNLADDPDGVVDRFTAVFRKYITVDRIRILVDNNEGYLESIFDKEDEMKISVPISDESFDTLLNQRKQIIFKETIEHDYGIASIRLQLQKLLDITKSEGFIMLTEGRHIVSLILLGKKEGGNEFNDYDYDVFSKVYSSLFVVGYYLKNISNEAVVGTVNREIRMSGQIITSIQENMDLIRHPNIDCGYKMIPAHNIGGEFVDFIRLTDTRHIFIIGALNGRGIASSMNMVILKSIIRTFLEEISDFKELVVKVNSFIRDNLPKGTYFAGTFGLIDFSTDTMYYINCGSPALFLYTRSYNNVIEIQGDGKILGFVKDITKYIRIKKIKLAQGDIVLACTDGLIESKSLRGEKFGKNRIQSVIMENVSFPADKISQFSYDTLVQFTSKALEEDITVLTLKYVGGK